FALTTAGLECPDDPVVHRGSDPLVRRRVHRPTGSQESLLLVPMDAPIAFRLVPSFDAHAETMKRRRREQWRVLETSPVNRRTEHAERSVDRRQFVSFS